MSEREFEVVVIGGGSAGYAAARTARQFRERVAIVDGAAELGGLCILRGCMPSKTLLYAAEIQHLAAHGERFGLRTSAAPPDLSVLRARKRRIIAEFAEYRAGQLQADRFTLFRAAARFTAPDRLQLADGTVLTADRFIVATGSVVAWPAVPGLAEARPWTSDDVLDLERLPETAIVLGGGVVACELAQLLHRLGSRTTLVQRSPRLLREMPAESAEAVRAALAGEGLAILTDTRLRQVRRDPAGGGYTVEFEHVGASRTLTAEALVQALGRGPATASLNLAAAGVETRASGHILADPHGRTTNPRIYAAGDCSGPVEIVHVAIAQGEIAARHACGQAATPVNLDWLTRVVFTDPQAAVCGLTEEQARARGRPVSAASYPFADHGKSILMEARHGFVKVVADARDGTLLGAECVGRDAGELIHALAVALPLGAKAADLLRAHWYHPTLSEIWTYPLEEIQDRLSV